jgi:photosystem II stability/assembly factor-like uncharacterized protein
MLTGGPGDTGIYRSTDGGKTWQAADAGLTNAAGLIDDRVRSVWFSPGPVSLALAGTQDGGVYRSTDGGKSWTSVYRTTGARQFTSAGSTIYAATDAGLLSSGDAGKTWSVSLAGSANTVTSIGGTTLASLSNAALYSLVGGTWKLLSTMPASAHEVEIDPFNTAILYAGLDNGPYDYNLYASMDGGLTFSKIAYPSGMLGTQAIAFSVHYPNQVYIAGDGTAGWIKADGNANPTYNSVSLGDDTRYIHVEANPTGTDDRCYAATDQGVYMIDPCSKNGAPSTGLTSRLYINWITGFAVSSDGQSIVAMVQDYSAYASNDAGQTWHGLPIGEDGTAAFSPTDPLRCYGFNGALYVSSDGCKTVTKTVSYGSPVTQADVIAFDPKTPTTMYLVGGQSGGNVIVVSTDGGDTFASTNWVFTNPNQIVVDPKNGQHIVVGTAKNLSVSFDGGKTWSQSAGMTSGPVAVDPVDGNTILAVDGSAAVYRSSDGGKSFSKISSIPGGAAFNGIGFSDRGAVPYVAIATSDHGLWLSKDTGQTWMRIDTDLITHKFLAVQWLNGSLYFASYGQGIMKSSAPLQ